MLSIIFKNDFSFRRVTPTDLRYETAKKRCPTSLSESYDSLVFLVMLCIGVRLVMFCNIYMAKCTVRKVSVFGVVLVRVFPHFYWTRRDKNISPCSIQMRENANQNNPKHVHFLRRANDWYFVKIFFWKKPPQNYPKKTTATEIFFCQRGFYFW